MAAGFHGIARLDDCGRVRDAEVFQAVGLGPGQRVAVTVTEHRAVVTADEASDIALDCRGRLVLTVSQRRLLGLHPGDRVVVSCNADRNRIVVQSTEVLDGLVA